MNKKSLEDYFLGTHTLKEFQRMRNHYREYCENSNDSLLKNYKKMARCYFLWGKVIPNILTSVSLISYLYTKQPIFIMGVGVGEFQRHIHSPDLKRSMETAYKHIIPKRHRIETIDDYCAFNSNYESFILDQQDKEEEDEQEV